MLWIADPNNSVTEPCAPNNQVLFAVTPPAETDLALSNLRTNPATLPVTPPGVVRTVTIEVDLHNLGSAGTSATALEVTFWRGDPYAGGQMIGSHLLNRDMATLPVTVSLAWNNVASGQYRIFARVQPVAEESNIANNTTSVAVTMPGYAMSFPIIIKRLTPTP